jgi:teichuronic acid biosynthesis glycosyltransferase TuaG
MAVIHEDLISIVMPIYNGAILVGETLDSIINQSYDCWELIIVNDKSTDNTVNIVNKYIQKDSRIKLINLDKNCGGPARPRNIGIENSKGEFVALIDADDIWHRDKLLECSKVLDNDIIYHKERCFNQNIDDGIGCPTKNIQELNDLHKNMLINGNIFSPSAIIIKKTLFTTNKFNESMEYHGVEDYDLWLRLAKQNKYKYKFIDKVLGYYRLHDAGISKNFKKHGQKERKLIHDHFSEFSLLKSPYMFIIKYKKLFRSLLINIIRTVQYKQKLDIPFYYKEFLKCF